MYCAVLELSGCLVCVLLTRVIWELIFGGSALLMVSKVWYETKTILWITKLLRKTDDKALCLRNYIVFTEFEIDSNDSQNNRNLNVTS